MPNIKSAKKRVKVAEIRAARNKANNTALKTLVKKANVAIGKSPDQAGDAVREAIKAIDRSVSKGILHKNTAARKKSSLVLKLNKAN